MANYVCLDKIFQTCEFRLFLNRFYSKEYQFPFAKIIVSEKVGCLQQRKANAVIDNALIKPEL